MHVKISVNQGYCRSRSPKASALEKYAKKMIFFPLTLPRENPIRGTFHRTFKRTRSFVMKYIYSQSEGVGEIGKGFIKRWVGCALGLVLFLSAAGSVALAQSGSMTQGQYLQW